MSTNVSFSLHERPSVSPEKRGTWNSPRNVGAALSSLKGSRLSSSAQPSPSRYKSAVARRTQALYHQ